MLLAQLVVVLVTEAEEVAEEAVVMAVEAAEAVVAKGIIPALIVFRSMESTSLIPSTVLPQMNGINLATMAANRCSACVTLSTVSSLLLEEAEAVKEEAGAVQLRL